MKFSLADDFARQAHQHVADARFIAKRAEEANRDFTRHERAEVADHIAQAELLKAKAAEAADDADLLSKIRDADRAIFGKASFGPEATSMPGPWGRAYAAEHGFKDSIAPSGSLTVPDLSAGFAPLDDHPTSFLQAIQFVPLDGTNSFQFTRQSERTLRAASVLPGHLKPTSDLPLEPVTDHCRTIAHLSGGVDRATIADTSMVQTFLDDQLALGVTLELEHMTLLGDPTDVTRDDFAGILVSSGINVQHFDTSPLATARKALTRLQRARLAGPFLFVMNATTWESFELLESELHYQLADPGTPGSNPPVDGSRQYLWGVRVALSEAMDDDRCLIGDFSSTSVRIREREATRVDWSEATQLPIVGDVGGATATGFATNRIQWRCEGRYGIELRRPWAFCDVSLSGVEGS